MKIKRFFEMYQAKYNYDNIIRILKKTHGWGQGSLKYKNQFEENEQYFLNPADDNDYVEQFHIYLTDLSCGRLRGEYNNDHSLRLGKWKIGIPVISHTSIYNKLT